MFDSMTSFLNEFLSIEVLQTQYWNNSLQDYLTSLIVLLALVIFLRIFQGILLMRLKHLAEKTKTDIDDALIEIVQSIRPTFYSFIAFYISIQLLVLHPVLDKVVSAVLIIWVVYQVIKALQALVSYIAEKSLSKTEGGESGSAVQAVKLLSKIVLWAIGGLLILSNLGVDVTSLVAGLGIGGIAIALALQNILSDLFSSFALYFDKPFVVGDFIVVGKHMGTVEKIGIKTTRLRSVQGEEIVISNKELTSAIVQNFKRMDERRIVFQLGVVYTTSNKKLEKGLDIIKEIIDKESSARLDRAHFTSFDDSALTFEVVYYVDSREYGVYRDIQQNINFAIKEAFDKEKIEFAFPTQTLYLEK